MGNKSGKAAGGSSGEPKGNATPSPQLGRRASHRAASYPLRASRGQVDLRLLICGHAGTGKTTLVDRLTGRHFNPAYIPTAETRIVEQRLTFKLADEMNVAIYDCATGDENVSEYYGMCEVPLAARIPEVWSLTPSNLASRCSAAATLRAPSAFSLNTICTSKRPR